MEFNLTYFFLGCAGGLLPDVLRFVKDRTNPDLPDYFKTVKYWVGVLLLVLIGGFASYLLRADSVVNAVTYGFTAPEILSAALSKPLEGMVPTKGGRGFSLREWWSV